ncbi:MAG: sensor domain-containing diguanylate cyclase [Acidobacteria bacterium]|jgi:diguanylate cyclase (GGDEF)-like protein|nr:sensor domain-containing diguanylate cyclase [Acidobacteriota bacterium]
MPSERRDGAGRDPLARAERNAARQRARADALARRLELFTTTVRAAGSLLDPEMVAQFIMERAAGMLEARRFRLYRVDEAAGVLRLDARRDPEGAPAPVAELPLGTGLAGWVARWREPIRLAGAAADPRFESRLEWPQGLPPALLALPLISRGRVIGVAELADPPGPAFRAADVRLLAALLDPAAIALENAILFRKLEERTVTDDLTRLYNARFMQNYLRRESKRAARYGHQVALLFLDLDGFKQVNDRHGHMAGSRTLAEVGEVLRCNVRDIDVVARYGGDEFTIVLAETGTPGALAMAERIRRRIEEHEFLRGMGLAVHISASIGVACFPDHAHGPDALLAAADAAMYRVKYSGKNGVQLARPVGNPEPVPAPVP